jgi:probable phosphoglycerate mutase
MKTIYFVRHGESEGNVGARYQGDSTPLTPNGEDQARFIGERVSRLKAGALVASPMLRAQQTASFISDTTGLRVETSALFAERKRPTIQVDNLKESPEVQAAEREIIRSSGISGYRFADEENFDDLKERAGEALAYLESHSSQSIVVVSHGVFLRNILARAIYGDEMSGKDCTAILETFIASNTGLTVLTYEEARRKPWQVLSWNDHAHLG